MLYGYDWFGMGIKNDHPGEYCILVWVVTEECPSGIFQHRKRKRSTELREHPFFGEFRVREYLDNSRNCPMFSSRVERLSNTGLLPHAQSTLHACDLIGVLCLY